MKLKPYPEYKDSGVPWQAACNYWKGLKNRLGKEGSESVTKCNRLKLSAADGKRWLPEAIFFHRYQK
jgi:hypothetical protein